MIVSFRTDRSGQTVQTQIRLLRGEQSDQCLNCLLFHLHLFEEQELSHDSIARLNCALPITKTISVIR